MPAPSDRPSAPGRAAGPALDPGDPGSATARRGRRSTLRLLAAACGGAAAGLVGASSAARAPSDRPLELQGHRGARGLAPESTLRGFARALEIGVDTLEFDTGVSADDVVVVHHDRRLNPDHTRGRDGRWIDGPGPLVRQLSAAELATFDVGRARPGGRTAAVFPRQEAMDGERIPTLAQVLDLVQRTAPADLRLNIETKLSPLAPHESAPPEVFVRLLLRALRSAGALPACTIQSFDWRTLREVQRQAPGTPTACLTSQQPSGPGVDDGVWTAGLRRADFGSVPRMVKASGATVWSPFHGDVTADAVREAHALGLTVSVWTVNDAVAMDRMIDLGVDALITDEPDRAREVMAARGLVLPPQRSIAPR